MLEKHVIYSDFRGETKHLEESSPVLLLKALASAKLNEWPGIPELVDSLSNKADNDVFVPAL
jgi:hypothetical protein